MGDVVDSHELLRRIQRGRDRAEAEERAWQVRAEQLRATDPEGAREAVVRAWAYEAVFRVLDEIAVPGGYQDPDPSPDPGRGGDRNGVRPLT